MADLDSGTPTTHCTRPSFYAAIRLARLILFVRERFKSRIRSRRLSVESKAVGHRDFSRTDAVEEISRALNIRSRSGTFLRPQCSGKNIQGEELGFSTLLHDLNVQTKPWGGSVSEIAAEDQQLLQYDAQRVPITLSSAVLSHTLELTTLVLDRLQASSGSHSGKDGKISNSDCSLLKRERFVANLEHILRCLQQAVVEALIHNTWRLIETDILHWHQRWQQRRQSTDRAGWFAEWPNGQHPLNTTWPWNVKPSLVILWGVCWMFYDFDFDDDDRNNSWMTCISRPDRQDEFPLNENLFWTRQPSQALPDQVPTTDQSSTNQPQPQRKLIPSEQKRRKAEATQKAEGLFADSWFTDNGAWITDSGINTFQDASWLQPQGGDRVTAECDSHAQSQDPTRALINPHSEPNIPIYLLPDYPTTDSTYPYIYSNQSVTSESFAAQSSPWPYNLGNKNIDTSYPLFNELQSPYCQQQPQQQFHPQNLVNSPQMIEREVGAEPYVHRLPQQTTPRPNLEVPIIQMTDYPSPRSVVSAPRMSPCPSRLPFSPSLEANPPSSTIESPQSRRESSVRSTDPTRNDQGLLYCNHPDCANEFPVFSRTCEYTKHMDKHNRPYVCEEPGCEKIQGFTYSGGLIRHQREVHRQHGGPKASCMCPHRDCKRSAGRGFSRKENLYEHLRRVHRGVGDEKETSPTGMTTAAPSSTSQQVGGGEQVRKRRRFDGGDDDDDNEVDDVSSSRDLQLQVKRLRRELRQKDERLKALELKVERLARG